MKEKINVAAVLKATEAIQNETDAINSLIAGFGSNVSENLNEVWQSDNAAKVQQYLEKMKMDVQGINNSITNIKQNISTFAASASNVDTVNLNSNE